MASNQQASGSPSKKRGLAASIKRFVGLLRGRKGQNNTYTRGPIAGTMLRTALVMLPGTLTISGYNLVV